MNTYEDYFEFIAEKANSYKKLSVMIQLQRYKSDLEALKVTKSTLLCLKALRTTTYTTLNQM